MARTKGAKNKDDTKEALKDVVKELQDKIKEQDKRYASSSLQLKEISDKHKIKSEQLNESIKEMSRLERRINLHTSINENLEKRVRDIARLNIALIISIISLLTIEMLFWFFG